MLSNSSSRLSLISLEDGESGSVKDGEGKGERKHGKVHRHGEHGQHAHSHHHHRDKILGEVVGWLQAEKAKLAAKKPRKRTTNLDGEAGGETGESVAQGGSNSRTSSMSSEGSGISLDKLQKILEAVHDLGALGVESLPGSAVLGRSPSLTSRRPSVLGRRRSSARRYGAQSSDTEYHDGDVVVPSCDVVLDNSKTMSYPGGGASAESSDSTVTLSTSKRADKERRYWIQFKSEIVRLAHTLRLKGWRRVPLERGGDIEVERLSGALTNAVYVVSPPKDLTPTLPSGNQPPGSTTPKRHSAKTPTKLLLRIYGPQVEHLIDRENELGILKRLARKKIGPRLLGTFTNGRFEEYFKSTTLKAEDLRNHDTSRQIAKRMRELHDGIDLLDRERDEGPFVWRNWDKWVDRCEQVITYLDREILSKSSGKGEAWRERGLVCGVEWQTFKSAVDKYRKWLDDYYKKKGGVENQLVFAHNDVRLLSHNNGIILTSFRHNMATFSASSQPSPQLLP